MNVLSQHTAGSPTEETVKWTHLTRPEIAQLLLGEGISVSVTVVDQFLERHDYRKCCTVLKAVSRLASAMTLVSMTIVNSCGSVRYWWKHYGSKHGPNAHSILLFDGGGSNGSRQYLFKQVLQRLSNQIDGETRIAHCLHPHNFRWAYQVRRKVTQEFKETMEVILG